MNEHLDHDAAALGFRPAPRPGVDETRYAFAGPTHTAYVTAPHELHRGVRNPAAERKFRELLRFGRGIALADGQMRGRTYLAGSHRQGTIRLQANDADSGAIAAADAVEFSSGPTAADRELEGLIAQQQEDVVAQFKRQLDDLPSTDEG